MAVAAAVIVWYAYGRGLIVLLTGGGILQKPVASNTGNSSRTRPGIDPSTIRLKMSISTLIKLIPIVRQTNLYFIKYLPFLVAMRTGPLSSKLASVGKNVAP